MRTGRWALATASIPVYALSVWKTKRIPGQISRIDSELKKRGSKVTASSIDINEFLVEEEVFLTLEQEIAVFADDTAGGIKPSQAELEAIAWLLANIEDDDDVSPDVKKQIVSSFK
jgi:hypothetical protein